jgi:ankyrin repeat protein
MVRRTLDELPKNLPEAYDRILRNIDKSRAATTAREVLRWLVHAQRQLATSELLEVTGFLIQEGPRFDREEVLGDLDDILRICSSLVSVTTSEDGTDSQSDERSGRYAALASGYDRLAHASVKEYLVSDSPCLAHYSLHDQESHDILASCCLVYLLRFEADEWTTYDCDSAFPLASYAANFWTEHARISDGWSQQQRDLSMELLTRKNPAFRAWSHLGARRLSEQLPLLAASSEGLTDAVRMILHKSDNDIDTQWNERNALHEASAKGYEEIVEMLLQRGADVNIPSGRYGANALGIACEKGHEGIAIRLLAKGADANAEHGWSWTGNAFAIACRQGRESVVERMLTTGALVGTRWEDVDAAMAVAIEKKYYTIVETLFDVSIHGCPDAALRAACGQGNENLVQKLLDKAAVADIPSLVLKNSLRAACAGGHEGTVEILLARGASADNDALRAACAEGHEGTVEILLARGASADNDALRAACAEGHEGTVEILLARGASADNDTLRTACAEGDKRISEMLFRGRHSATSDALRAAHVEGQGRIMRMFLTRGARADQLAFPGALQHACCGGYSYTVKALLQNDCGSAFLGEAGGESLQMACAGGHQSIVEMLLANGVSANYTGGTHGNTLTIACERGDDKIVKMLLDKGANASGAFFPSGALFPQTRRYATPLQTACEGGHTTIVRMLLEKGADANSRGGYYGTPLHAACVRGQGSIVDMLLTHGADVNALGDHGWDKDCYIGVHSLTIACERGQKAIVKMLLARGADVNNHKGKPGQWLMSPTIWLPDRNALVAACDRGHEGIVRKILLKTAKADYEEGCNGSALLAACVRGYEEIVEMLLDKGAKVAIQDAYNDAIQTASDAGFEGIVEMLLDRAAGCRITTASRANAMPTEQVVLAKRRRLHQGSLPSTAHP